MIDRMRLNKFLRIRKRKTYRQEEVRDNLIPLTSIRKRSLWRRKNLQRKRLQSHLLKKMRMVIKKRKRMMKRTMKY